MEIKDVFFTRISISAGKKRKSAGPAGRRKGGGRIAPLRKRGRGGIALSDDEDRDAGGSARDRGPQEGADNAADDAADTVPGEPDPAVPVAPAKEEAPKPKSKVTFLPRPPFTLVSTDEPRPALPPPPPALEPCVARAGG